MNKDIINDQIFDMPSKRKKIYVQFFYSGTVAPFICGADGFINSIMLDEIESEYLEGYDPDADDGVFNEVGDYLFEVNKEQAQTGEFGRIELPEYWNMSFVKFIPLGN